MPSAGSAFSTFSDFHQEKNKEKSFLRNYRPLPIGIDFSQRSEKRLDKVAMLGDKYIQLNSHEQAHKILNETDVFGTETLFSASTRKGASDSKRKLQGNSSLVTTTKTQVLFMSRTHFFKYTLYKDRQTIRRNAKSGPSIKSTTDGNAHMKWIDYRKKLVSEILNTKQHR